MLTLLLILSVLFLIAVGFGTNVADNLNNNERHQEVAEFQEDLVTYANGGCRDRQLMAKMLSRSPGVEEALGADNYVSGVTCLRMMLNGVPVLPFVLRGIDQHVGDTFLASLGC